MNMKINKIECNTFLLKKNELPQWYVIRYMFKQNIRSDFCGSYFYVDNYKWVISYGFPVLITYIIPVY